MVLDIREGCSWVLRVWVLRVWGAQALDMWIESGVGRMPCGASPGRVILLCEACCVWYLYWMYGSIT